MATDRRPGDDDAPTRGYRWADDVEVQRETIRAQVKLILEAVPGAAFHPPGDAADMEYLYVAGRMLVRDEDVDRVARVVPGEVRRRDPQRDRSLDRGRDAEVNGLSVFVPAEHGLDIQAALQAVDDALGVGVATPDHIFYVTPTHFCCPADEPTPVHTDGPWPAVAADTELGRGVLVTVVDTGLVDDLTGRHTWLAGVTGEPDGYDGATLGEYTGHGSFVAGVVRAVAPAADVVVENLLDRAGAVVESEMTAALGRSLDLVPDVISMSAGGTSRHNVPPLGFEVFWRTRLSQLKGTVMVVAAGNQASRQAFWPAAFPWTVSVGAVDSAGGRAPFSNFGSWVDVYALGVDHVNAYPDGTYGYVEGARAGTSATFETGLARWSGTSFATPLVAGMVAARVSRTGQSGSRAARSILRRAARNATAGVGAIAEAPHALDPDG